MIVTQVLAAALGTVAFALLFGVPRKYYPYCGLIGGAGWLMYCLLEPVLNAAEATCPVTIFLISGIIPLVPGAGIYWSAFYMVTDQLTEAGEAGFAAVKAAVAIVLGIVCVFELPQGVFNFVRRDRKELRTQKSRKNG